MLFFAKKIANSEFCFHCKGVSDPSDRFGFGLIRRLMIKFGYQMCLNLPNSWNYLGAAVKNVFGKMRFRGRVGVGVFPLNFGVENSIRQR
jgi:hypothetical protein